MKSVHALSILAVFLFVSVAFKMQYDKDLNYDRLESLVMESAENRLRETGFTSTYNPYDKVVIAIKQDCALWLSSVSASGGDKALFLVNYGSLGQIKYAYRGALYDRVPTFRVMRERLFERIGAAFGRVPARLPVYQLIASPQCDISDIIFFSLDSAM